MTLSIGYLHSDRDELQLSPQRTRLLACGCDAVRIESRGAAELGVTPVLELLCDILGEGDELVAPDLTHFGRSPGAIAALVERVESRGAWVRFLDPAVSTRDAAGRALVSALRQLAPVPDAAARRRRAAIDPRAVQALSAHGLGPSQIARRLGVSRMTVWRKLAAEHRA